MSRPTAYNVGLDAGIEDWDEIDIANVQVDMTPEEVVDFECGYERGLELRAIRQEEIEYDRRDLEWEPTWVEEEE